MAPPRPPADETAAEAFELLERLERCWRDALSFVSAGEPLAAAQEIDSADQVLAGLGSLDELQKLVPAGALPRLAQRIEELRRLHSELAAATSRARDSVAAGLADARRGRSALAAYGPSATDERHRCDALA
jgi:hypothetical protein